MSTQPTTGLASAESSDGMILESNKNTPEEIESGLGEEKKETTASEAGKKGAEAKKVIKKAKEREEKKAEKEEAEEEKQEAKPTEEGPETEQEASGEEKEAKPEEEVKEEGEEKEELTLKGKVKKRVEKATREAAEAKRELARVRQELAQIRQQSQGPAQTADEPPPRADQYPRDEDYQEAIAQWAYRKGQREASKKLEEEQAKRQHEQQAAEIAGNLEKAVQAHNKRMEAAIKANSDFKERLDPEIDVLPATIARAQGLEIDGRNIVSEAMFNSEHGPALMLYLSDHIDEYQRIAALHPYRIWFELGKIEARVSGGAATSSSASPTPSKAKPPVERLKGGGQGADPDTVRDDDSDEDALSKIERAKRKRAS